MKLANLTPKQKKNLRILKLFIISLIFVGIAASIAVVGCNYVINRNFKETFYCVSSIKVNSKIRVVQISDLHDASFGDDMVKRVESLKPDLIIYTGDSVDSDDESEDNVVALCKSLAQIAPSYYIYGNNEVERYYDTLLTKEALDEKFGFNDKNRDANKLLEVTDTLTQKLETAGVKVLKNKMETVLVGSTKVDIYGVLTSNPSAFWPYSGESFSDYLYTNENNLKITLVHEPAIFEEFTPEFWGDLMLAGHTHGGVMKIPMVGPLYTYDNGFLPERSGHYIYGRYDVQGRPLIVSSGLDNKNLLRINNQPEIVVVDVNKF